jgi:hypothetical protein
VKNIDSIINVQFSEEPLATVVWAEKLCKIKASFLQRLGVTFLSKCSEMLTFAVVNFFGCSKRYTYIGHLNVIFYQILDV